MRKAYVGAVVIYHPAIDDPRYHDRGHRESLPAIVTKVWDAVENLQVLPPDCDLNVLQDAQVKTTFTPFVKFGTGVGNWEWPKE